MARDVIVFDFSLIRGLWEIRAKKYKERRKKEKERMEKSSLEKIKQEWHFMLECRKRGIPQTVYAKNGFIDTSLKLLDKIEANSLLFKESNFFENTEKERNKFIFELFGEDWKELPETLKEQTHLKEWHINNTKISIIPSYIKMFQELRVLEMSQNLITNLPPEIDPQTSPHHGLLPDLLSLAFPSRPGFSAYPASRTTTGHISLSGPGETVELLFPLCSLQMEHCHQTSPLLTGIITCSSGYHLRCSIIKTNFSVSISAQELAYRCKSLQGPTLWEVPSLAVTKGPCLNVQSTTLVV
ncbi:leucine-rich repeat-containing protein 2 isoform X3 [Rhinatrema bivittatum]|uniref:leucine-rich repeat-containing protein 2 isoform X3 n=1 Tax=Rhinatrema bivittatum TaxID=194408 RepID=UPI00112EE6A6|nr:leucine-rich repeat-containing protein 2 isoform X3 [Rhinatrema bivittatum]